jgi:hypothetical protein
MTKRNSPREIKVAGKVRNTNTGLMNTFKRLSTRATSKAVVNESTEIPGSK